MIKKYRHPKSKSFSNKTFIERTMGRDEKHIMTARLHWFYLFIGFLWLIGFFLTGSLFEYILWEYFESNIPAFEREVFGIQISSRGALVKWFLTVIGIMVFAFYVSRYITTRVALTDRRLIIRQGLIIVKVEEVDLEEVKREFVNTGLLGRFLNYGEIHFDSRFVGDVSFPDIARPYQFLRKVHETRTALGGDIAFAPKHKQSRQQQSPEQAPAQKKDGPRRRVLVSENDDYVVYRKKKPSQM